MHMHPPPIFPSWHHTELIQSYQQYVLCCTLHPCDYFVATNMYLFFLKILFILFLGREGEKHQCVLFHLSHTPNRGPGLHPRHVPWLGIEPATLWFGSQAGVQSTETHSQGQYILLNLFTFFTQPPNPIPSGNHQSLPVSMSLFHFAFILFVLFCFFKFF